MNVSLTPELEALVHEKVASGLYHSASEVIREALRLLREQEQVRRVRLEGLRQEIAPALAQARRGEVSVLDMAKLKAQARRRKGHR